MTHDIELLTVKDLERIYRLHRSTIWRMLKEGRIPKPIEGWIGTEKRWRRSDITAHIDGMTAAAKAEEVS